MSCFDWSCFEHSSAHYVQIKAVISTGTDNIKFDQCASAIKPKLKKWRKNTQAFRLHKY